MAFIGKDSSLNDFGIARRGGGVVSRLPKRPSGVVSPGAASAGASVVGAPAVPSDVTAPTKIVLPPSLVPKTQALLGTAQRVVQASKAKVAEIKQTVSAVKSLKGFMGFGGYGAADPKVVANAAAVAKQKANEAKANVQALLQVKSQLVVHKSDLLQQAANIKGQRATLKAAIAKKVEHHGELQRKLAAIPKTITK